MGQITKELNNKLLMYETLTQNALVGILWITKNNHCEFANKQYSKFSGLEYKKLLKNGWLSTIHENDIENLLSDFKDAYSSNETNFTKEYRVVDVYGKVIDVLWRANRINGGSKGFVCSVIDITKKKRTLKELIKCKKEHMKEKVH